MNTGIGSPGAQGGNFVGAEFAQRFLELVLHGLARGLTLPTLVARARVADAERDPHT
jgi:hypothetical protein